MQILTFTDLPSRTSVCLWTFAKNLVLVCRLEWLTLLPVIPDLKQISQRIVIISFAAVQAQCRTAWYLVFDRLDEPKFNTFPTPKQPLP